MISDLIEISVGMFQHPETFSIYCFWNLASWHFFACLVFFVRMHKTEIGWTDFKGTWKWLPVVTPTPGLLSRLQSPSTCENLLRFHIFWSVNNCQCVDCNLGENVAEKKVQPRLLTYQPVPQISLISNEWIQRKFDIEQEFSEKPDFLIQRKNLTFSEHLLLSHGFLFLPTSY